MRWRGAFRAMRHRPFRVYWAGQAISVTGGWMQTLAQGWLLYRLTDSPLALGMLSAARFGPSLLGALVAGVVTDRLPRRPLVLATQALGMLQAAALAALTLSGHVQAWHILAVALVQGAVDTFDMPARQILQVDMVGIDDLQSAVSLNASAFNAARIVGPAVAGLVVAAWGEGVCFAVNAVSYGAVLAALLTLPPGERPERAATSWRDELAAGVRFAFSAPAVRAMLLVVAVTSTVGLSYSTLLPVVARDVLRGGVHAYGLLLAGAGIGAILGALRAAAGSGTPAAPLRVLAGQGTLGAGLVALALMRDLRPAVLVMVVIGFAVALQLSTTNGFLQASAPPALRGRVMSIYFWIFVGMSPVGGIAAGWLAERAGAPATAAAAGVFCMAAAAAGALRHGARAAGPA
jgi:MFS family permease